MHLAAGQVVGGVNTGTDTLLSVESITGTDLSDTYDATGFSGSSTNAGSNGTFNEFEGRGGNDTIIGNGNTRVAFYNATAGVTVTLGVGGIIGSGTSTGNASVGSDTFTGVNAVRGSSFNDIITGDNGGNTLDGRAGADVINGAGGNDTIIFSQIDAARDVIDGGTGTDTIDYSVYAAPLTVALNGSTLAIVSGSGSTDATSDTIVNVENFIGGSGNDTITGDTNNIRPHWRLGRRYYQRSGRLDFASYQTASAGVIAIWRTKRVTPEMLRATFTFRLRRSSVVGLPIRWWAIAAIII